MPPLFFVTPDLWLDVIVAVVMIVAEVYILTQILPRSGPPPAMTRMVIGSTALVGSSGVLMALLGAYLQSNLNTYSVVLLAFNGMMLLPPGLWFISLIVFEDRKIRAESWFWPLAITAMASSAELLMGLFFSVAAGVPLATASVLAGTLTSVWYLWSMASAMVALLLWVRLDRAVRDPLLGLAAAGVVAPFVPVDPLVGAALMTGGMTLTLLVVFRGIRHGHPAGAEAGKVLTGVVAAFFAMSVAGFGLALAPGSVLALLAFGGVMAAAMTAEFLFLVRAGLRPGAANAAPLAHPSEARAGGARPSAASEP
ncbi:MAG: hypothetical protein L3K01_00735 [Thermoplasmata archaeon]|nr:hypothetical protein [Thermoplasmata archaeon]